MRNELSKSDFTVPALLVLLSVVPTIGGIVRLMSVADDVAVTADNARFLHAPAPVVMHVVSATVYSLLGAFQFSRGLHRRLPRVHRRAGVILALSGLMAGVTGLWMTLRYPIPTSLQGPLLHSVRVVVASAMIVSLLVAWFGILRRNVLLHEAFMIRAYALGQGAGTQVLVLLPWMLTSHEAGGPTRDLLMTLAWVINSAIAEVIIRRSTRVARPRAPKSTDHRSTSRGFQMATVMLELLKDFLSAIAFLVANAIFRDVRVATGVAMAVALIQLGVSLARRQPIPALQWLSLVLVVSLGSASLITADSRFIRFKPSFVHVAIAVAMLKRGWQLRYLPEIVRARMTERELVSWGYVWAGAMALMGVVNAIAAQWLDVGAWGLMLSGLMVAKFMLFGVQYASMRRLIARRIALG